MVCDYTNEADCINNGCYWYDGSCHSTIVCSDITNGQDCVNNDCYWYNHGCHSTMSCGDLIFKPECIRYDCFWWHDSICRTTPEPIYDIETWVINKGTATNIDIAEIFEIVDSYIYNQPPPNSTFIPSLSQVFGIIDYYLGFIEEGNAETGCDFYPYIINTGVTAKVIGNTGNVLNGNLYFEAQDDVYNINFYKWDATTDQLTISPVMPAEMKNQIMLGNQLRYCLINENEGWWIYRNYSPSFETGMRKYNINNWALEDEMVLETDADYRVNEILKLSSGNLLVFTAYQQGLTGPAYAKFTLIDGATNEILDTAVTTTISSGRRSFGKIPSPIRQLSNGDIVCLIKSDSFSFYDKYVLIETGGQIVITQETLNFLNNDTYPYNKRVNGEVPACYMFDNYTVYTSENKEFIYVDPHGDSTLLIASITITDVNTGTVQIYTYPDRMERVNNGYAAGLLNGKFWVVFSPEENMNYTDKLYLYTQDGSSFTKQFLLQLQMSDKYTLPRKRVVGAGGCNYVAATDLNNKLYIIKVDTGIV